VAERPSTTWGDPERKIQLRDRVDRYEIQLSIDELPLLAIVGKIGVSKLGRRKDGPNEPEGGREKTRGDTGTGPVALRSLQQ